MSTRIHTILEEALAPFKPFAVSARDVPIVLSGKEYACLEYVLHIENGGRTLVIGEADVLEFVNEMDAAVLENRRIGVIPRDISEHDFRVLMVSAFINSRLQGANS
jgi:hypothetical protein